MTTRRMTSVIALVVVVLMTSGLAVDTSKAAVPVAPARAATELQLRDGVVFNHPFVKSRADDIMNYVIRTVNAVKRRQTIRIMTWNFDSPRLADAMVRAHQRGAAVRIIMSRNLAMKQGPKGSYNVLKRGLATRNNAGRKAIYRSWIRTCDGTCRGRKGAMHSKLMLIDKVGLSQYVVMQGSANFTGAAAYNQFNDWTTNVDDPALYNVWVKMFEQARKDRRVAPLRVTTGDVTSIFAPHGKQPDPAAQLLRTVKCTGATTTSSGRTVLRIANAVWGDDRGVRLARRVKALHNAGCNIRIVFMMAPAKVRNILRGIPAKQMLFITGAEANKFKDKYVHMKAMSIEGNVGGRTDARVVLTGSENWTHLGLVSDEQTLIIRNREGLTVKYRQWIDRVYKEAPRRLGGYIASANNNVRPMPDTVLGEGEYPFRQLEAELG